MAGKNTAHTHRHWKAAMGDLNEALVTMLAPALDHLHTCLVKVDAGRTQRAMSSRSAAMVGELGTQGRRILAAHGPRLDRVSEAQRAAGGLEEVAGDKRYHQA